MSEEKKFTREEIEQLELAPGTEHVELEGAVADLSDEAKIREAVEQAFDYRGDVTVKLVCGKQIEGYLFNRNNAATLADAWFEMYTADKPGKQRISYARLQSLEFSGKDRAAGKRWEDWVKNYNEKKAAGETISLAPEALD